MIYLFIYLFTSSNSISQMIKTKQKQIIKYIHKYKKEISKELGLFIQNSRFLILNKLPVIKCKIHRKLTKTNRNNNK